jgi:hypothetical protein
MSAPDAIGSLTPELRNTAIMVREAFPAGVPESAYQPLLALLYEGMSMRAVAQVVACYTGKPYPVVYNEVLGAVALADANGLDARVLGNVKQLLREHGYDDWLTKAE